MKYLTVLALALFSITTAFASATNAETSTPPPSLALVDIQATVLLMETIPAEPMVTKWVEHNGQLRQEYFQHMPRTEVPRFIQSVDEHFMPAFSEQNQFTIVGRSDINTLDREQQYAYNVPTDPSTLPQRGYITGAMYVMVITIDDYEDTLQRSYTNDTEVYTRSLDISAVAKIYDTTTWQLKDSYEVSLTQHANPSAFELESDKFLVAGARAFAQQVAAKATNRKCPFFLFAQPQTTNSPAK